MPLLDFKLSTYTFISGQWSLTSPTRLNISNLFMRYGRFDPKTRRYPSIEIQQVLATTPVHNTVAGRNLYEQTLLVEVWTKIGDLSRVNAEDDAYQMETEIERIVKANETAYNDTTTGVEWMKVGVGRELRDPDPTIIHRQLPVHVYYQPPT